MKFGKESIALTIPRPASREKGRYPVVLTPEGGSPAKDVSLKPANLELLTKV